MLWPYIDPIRLFCPPLIKCVTVISWMIFLFKWWKWSNLTLPPPSFPAPQTSNVSECKPGHKRNRIELANKKKKKRIGNNENAYRIGYSFQERTTKEGDTWMTNWNAFVAPFSTLSPYAERPARVNFPRDKYKVKKLIISSLNCWSMFTWSTSNINSHLFSMLFFSLLIIFLKSSAHWIILVLTPSGSLKTIPVLSQLDLGMLFAEPQHSSFSFCYEKSEKRKQRRS